MVDPMLTPIQVFGIAVIIGSVGGLAALLRSERALNLRSIATSVLYGGMLGVVVALLWFRYFHESGNIYFMLGLCGLLGMGGATVMDLVLMILKKGGVVINIQPKGGYGEDSRKEGT